MNLKNKKFIFIVNPKSGKLSKKKKIKLISDCFPSKPDIVFTKDSQETSILSAEAFKKDQIVVACGGDGTVNLVANQAIIYDGIMSILPLGRGNDFAKFIGINSINQFKRMLINSTILLLSLETLLQSFVDEGMIKDFSVYVDIADLDKQSEFNYVNSIRLFTSRS